MQIAVISSTSGNYPQREAIISLQFAVNQLSQQQAVLRDISSIKLTQLDIDPRTYFGCRFVSWMLYIVTDPYQELHAHLLMLQGNCFPPNSHQSQLSISLTCVDIKKTDIFISLHKKMYWLTP